MPAAIREIKGRIKAVKNIQRITKTMQMIATARFQAMLKKATQAKAYAERLQQMVGEVSAAVAGSGDASVSHPLIDAKPRQDAPTVLLVLSSNRGLAGSYNANVLRMVARLIADEPSKRRMEVVGKKGVGFFKFNRTPIEVVHTQFGDNPKYEDIHALAEQYMAEFADGKIAGVKVAYMKFISAGKQTPEVLQLLPLSQGASETSNEKKASANYEFSPDAATLLAELLPATVKTTLQRCFNDAVVSEQIARMVAMKAATDAAGKQGKSLQRRYNRARQAAITTELSEIIAGAAALN
jgi:F-type H+-transporting ATPase subunit gamma